MTTNYNYNQQKIGVRVSRFIRRGQVLAASARGVQGLLRKHGNAVSVEAGRRSPPTPCHGVLVLLLWGLALFTTAESSVASPTWRFSLRG